MKRLFYLLLIVSFLFLFGYLIRQDYIVPKIINPAALIFSVLLLFGGFLAQGWSWKVALDAHKDHVSLKKAMISQGMNVFAKYIPGKIWVILGRAGYLSENKEDLKSKSVISLKEQLIYLWVGFLVSAIPTVFYYRLHWISLLVMVIALTMYLVLFSPGIHRRSMGLLRRIMRMEPELPALRFRESIPLILSVSLVWICWTTGFYLFMIALSPGISPIMMFAFPLSVSLGLIAIILPGGLGLREGIIIGYLSLVGLAIEPATTISFLNRFWFIGGELFMFLTALGIRLGEKKRRKHHR